MSLIALDIDEVLLDCISRLNGLAKQLFNANIINQDAWCLGDRYGISGQQVSHIFSKAGGGAIPQSLKAAMSNLDNAEYFNTYGAKATRKNEVVKAIVIGGLLGALFAVIVNVIAHTLN